MSRREERLVVGLCASEKLCRESQFGFFLDWFNNDRNGQALPLRADHEVIRFPTYRPGSGDVGQCVAFRWVPPASLGVQFGGLLCLGELSPDPAPGILRDMRNLGRWQAMSIRAAHVTWDYNGETGGQLLIREVSLVSRIGDQADEGALVLATGPAAASVWGLLTGEDVPGA